VSHVAIADPFVRGSEDRFVAYCTDAHIDQSQAGRHIVVAIDSGKVLAMKLLAWWRSGPKQSWSILPGENLEPLVLMPESEPGHWSTIIPGDYFPGDGTVAMAIEWKDLAGRKHIAFGPDGKHVYEEVVSLEPPL